MRRKKKKKKKERILSVGLILSMVDDKPRRILVI